MTIRWLRVIPPLAILKGLKSFEVLRLREVVEHSEDEVADVHPELVMSKKRWACPQSKEKLDKKMDEKTRK